MLGGMAGPGMSILGSMTGLPLDPFSAAMAGGRLGFGMAGGGMGGLAMGGMAAGAMALPFLAAGAAAHVYGGAFTQGMGNQVALNSTLRSNFNFFGGQGSLGRGFSQNQMGQIGNTISQELRANPFTSAGELNQLISGGAQSGMFTGVREVQQFTERFRSMLSNLRQIQHELGGSLTEAMDFVRQSRQAGVFQQVDRLNYASELRGAEATSGLSRGQLMGLSVQGAQISRAYGGLGRQGAIGALRGAATLGSAIQSGVVNEEMLSEATGGLTGGEAVQAFTSRMLQRSGEFSRRAMGRYSIFAMSNQNGTGLNQEMLQRFMAGDLSVGDVSRTAHQNVGAMGRARALNQEGVLRGAVMEQGGMAAQIGMMRLAIGDRVMDQSDDRVSLFLQRRFRMSRPEAEMSVSMMRNQGTIATQEAADRMSASTQQRVQTDLRENRSMDAFMDRVSHEVQNEMGVTRAKELGRHFVTRISSLAERVMNDILGTGPGLSAGDQAAMNRLALGRATSADIRRLSFNPQERQALSGMDLNAIGSGGILETTSPEELLRQRNGSFSGGRVAAVREARLAQAARMGQVSRGIDVSSLQGLESDTVGSRAVIAQAVALSGMAGVSPENFRGYMQRDLATTANGLDAFMQRQGMTLPGGQRDLMGALMNRGGGRINWGGVGGGALRGAAIGTAVLPFIGTAIGAVAGGISNLWNQASGLEPGRSAADELAGGGDLIRRARVLTDEHGNRAGQTATIARLLGTGDMTAINRERARLGALAEGSRDMTAERIQGALGNTNFRESVGRILAANPQNVGRELEIARAGMGTGQESQAMEYILSQVENDTRGGRGISQRMRGLLSSGIVDREAIQARMRARQDLSVQFEGIAGAGYGGIADRLRNENANIGDINSRVFAAQSRLAGMNPESEEYQRAMSLLGSQGEFGAGQMQAIAGIRATTRALTGGGRRGAPQAAETALGLVTGNTFGSMNIEVGGRQIRSASQAFRMLQHGGANADSIRRQIVAQMGDVHGADELVQSMTNMASGGFTPQEAARLQQQVAGNEDIQRRQQRAAEERQRQQNPLDSTRNELLTNIRDTLREIKSSSGGGVPRGESGA